MFSFGGNKKGPRHGRRRNIAGDVPLTDLQPGEEATISNLSDNQEGYDRLRELGLSNGTPVRVIKLAPLGDPMEIKVRGYYLSLRRNMARHIHVRRRYRGGRFED